jgi:glycosyltransferase involved in cell wall biosynthesis
MTQKVSIITVCFNSEKTIRDTIESVLSQDYPNIEYIVIDGKSSDRTMSIIQEYGDRIAIAISEPDKGIYDAMNKGIHLASGEIIGMLNSDDIYMDTHAVSELIGKME